jgi:(p)ppGpp synthase/HD superfamily hydrolase
MEYSPRFESALVFAARLHARQARKISGCPYISHLLGVAAIAIDHGANEDEAIAALLHDAVEDQGGTATEAVIRQCFGETVAQIVRGCTDADTIPKPPWRARKEAYIHHLAEAPASVRLVSASDKLHNARAICTDLKNRGDAVWQAFKGGKEGTLWYYRSVTDVFLKLGPSDLATELDAVVREMELLAP